MSDDAACLVYTPDEYTEQLLWLARDGFDTALIVKQLQHQQGVAHERA